MSLSSCRDEIFAFNNHSRPQSSAAAQGWLLWYRRLVRIISQIVPKYEHIADLDAIFIVGRVVIPEIIFAHVIHAEADFLVEGDVADAGVGRPSAWAATNPPPVPQRWS